MNGDELFRFLAERTADVYWTSDGQGLLTYIAPQVRQLIGRDAGELVGEPLRSFVYEEDFAEAESLQNAILQRASQCTVAYRLRRPEGNPVWVEATVHAIRSSEGDLSGFAGKWQDISERRRIEEAYEFQGYHDSLTGLPNRRLFHDRLTFAMLVSNLRYPEDSVRVVQLVQQQIREPMAIDARELFLTASIGIAISPQDGEEVATLLASADAAMHTCKQFGGNGWHMHNSSVNERALQRLAVEMDLHRGLERSEFIVRYQPLLAIAHEQMTAVEALVRWQHPSRGELAPSDFIDVAEETGLIVGMGEQVIQSACAQASLWLAEGWDAPSICINVSARQFESSHLLEALDQAVLKHRVPPSVLQLEITEGTALRDLDRTLRILEELRARGIRVAIDDFGIGYSSLGYLKELPVSALKIDKTFISGIPDPRDAAIVAAVIDMGHALGLTVIAEGVETQEQMAFLREHQCDVYQGYLFSKPTTAAEITRMRRG